MSDINHTKAQSMLDLPDTKIQFILVDLGDANTWKEQNNILRYYEQKEKRESKPLIKG